MRKMIGLVVLAVLVTVAFAMPAQAVLVRNLSTGQTVFVDDFENVTVTGGDDDPVAGVGTWRTDGAINGSFAGESAATQYQVINDPVSGTRPGPFEGAQYFRIAGGNGTSLAATWTPQSTAGHQIQMEFMLARVDITSTWALDIVNDDASAWPSGRRMDLLFDASGNILHDLSVGPFDTGLDIVDGEWNRMQIDYTLGAGTYTLTVDNSLGNNSAVLNIKTGTTPDSIGALYFRFAGEFPWGGYVDAVPEPATLALLGLGGLMMLRRRR